MTGHNRKRTAVRLALALFVGVLTFWAPTRVSAACHSFTITGSTVTEGQKSTVTIRRDNTLDESSVRIRTANVTAKAPPDYEAKIMRVEFTNEQSRTVEIPTKEDKVPEDTETFQVKLDAGRGCRSFNTDYEYGKPATVTIKDDDAGLPVPTATATTAPTTPPRAISTPEDTPSPTPTKTPEATPTASPEETFTPLPTATPEDEDDDGVSTGLIVVAIGAFLLAAILAVLLTRAMRGGG